jgi:prepilin peptidase CpaA
MLLEPVLLAIVGAAVLAGAVYDAATLTIPNWISGLLIALFPVVAFNADLSWAQTGIHVGVGFAALVAGAALFAGGIIGGGDAKLFAAVSLYVGAAWFGMYAFAVAVAGGLLAVVVIALRWLASSGKVRFGWLQHLTQKSGGIPYGVAIAAGGLLVIPVTNLFAVTP